MVYIDNLRLVLVIFCDGINVIFVYRVDRRLVKVMSEIFRVEYVII